MKRHKASSRDTVPSTEPSASNAPGLLQPFGNAAIAEQFAAAAQQGHGPEVAMTPGQALGSVLGFGMAAANAFGSGGLPAALNPSGYWDTLPESGAPALIQPGPSTLVRPP